MVTCVMTNNVCGCVFILWCFGWGSGWLPRYLYLSLLLVALTWCGLCQEDDDSHENRDEDCRDGVSFCYCHHDAHEDTDDVRQDDCAFSYRLVNAAWGIEVVSDTFHVLNGFTFK